jgi:hypothetical protein
LLEGRNQIFLVLSEPLLEIVDLVGEVPQKELFALASGPGRYAVHGQSLLSSGDCVGGCGGICVGVSGSGVDRDNCGTGSGVDRDPSNRCRRMQAALVTIAIVGRFGTIEGTRSLRYSFRNSSLAGLCLCFSFSFCLCLCFSFDWGTR